MKSKRPGKQRKGALESPMHRKQKMLSAVLEKSLREDLNIRSMQIRSGDKVKVMRGDERGKEDKVRKVDLKKRKVTLEDLKVEKVDGTEVRPYVDPSNLMILEPDMSDERRSKIVERAGGEVSEELKKEDEEEEEEKQAEEKEKTGFKCEICGDVFDSKRGLSIHRGKSHPEYTK